MRVAERHRLRQNTPPLSSPVFTLPAFSGPVESATIIGLPPVSVAEAACAFPNVGLRAFPIERSSGSGLRSRRLVGVVCVRVGLALQHRRLGRLDRTLGDSGLGSGDRSTRHAGDASVLDGVVVGTAAGDAGLFAGHCFEPPHADAARVVSSLAGGDPGRHVDLDETTCDRHPSRVRRDGAFASGARVLCQDSPDRGVAAAACGRRVHV